MSAPGLSITLVFAPKPRSSQPPRPQRRHLAPNVVCMFDADRPAVANARRRGRLPRNVTRFEIPPFVIGEVVEIFHGGTNPNNGTRVKIFDYLASSGEFCVDAVGGTIFTFNSDGAPTGQGTRAFTTPKNLRHIPRLSRQRGAF